MSGFLCQCGGKTQTIDTRPTTTGVRRRRKCITCGLRFTTYEVVSHGDPSPEGVLHDLAMRIDEVFAERADE